MSVLRCACLGDSVCIVCVHGSHEGSPATLSEDGRARSVRPRLGRLITPSLLRRWDCILCGAWLSSFDSVPVGHEVVMRWRTKSRGAGCWEPPAARPRRTGCLGLLPPRDCPQTDGPASKPTYRAGTREGILSEAGRAKAPCASVGTRSPSQPTPCNQRRAHLQVASRTSTASTSCRQACRREALHLQSILHDHHVRAPDGVGQDGPTTESEVPRRLLHPQPIRALEPLPVVVHEGHQGDLHTKGLRHKPCRQVRIGISTCGQHCIGGR
jgi:hypothetical protein